MSTSTRRPAHDPPVGRRFEPSRLQRHSIISAYHFVVPVVSRRLAPPVRHPGEPGDLRAQGGKPRPSAAGGGNLDPTPLLRRRMAVIPGRRSPHEHVNEEAGPRSPGRPAIRAVAAPTSFSHFCISSRCPRRLPTPRPAGAPPRRTRRPSGAGRQAPALGRRRSTMTRITTLRVALYARVSSERQAQEGTIASQLEALDRRIR